MTPRNFVLSTLGTATSLRRSIAILLSGGVLTQLILFSLAPVLTRIYPPSAFGQYAIFTVGITIVGVLATGKYEHAVLLPNSDDEAWDVVCLASALTIPVTMALVVVLFLALRALPTFSPSNLARMPEINMGVALVLAGVAVVLSSWQGVLFAWLNRRQNYRISSLSRVAHAGGTAAAQLLIGIHLSGFEGLLIGSVAGLAASVAVQVTCGKLQRRIPSVHDCLVLARKYQNLPVHVIPTDLLGAALAQFPVYLLGARFSATEVGYYSLAQRALLAPMQLIAASVGEVFRSRAPAACANGNGLDLFNKLVCCLLPVAVIVGVPILLAGPELFAFIFGENWRHAGYYAQIVIPMFCLKFLVSPVSFMFVIAGRTKLDFYLHATLLLILLSILALSAQDWTAEKSLVAFSTAYACMYMLYFVLSRSFAKAPH